MPPHIGNRIGNRGHWNLDRLKNGRHKSVSTKISDYRCWNISHRYPGYRNQNKEEFSLVLWSSRQSWATTRPLKSFRMDHSMDSGLKAAQDHDQPGRWSQVESKCMSRQEKTFSLFCSYAGNNQLEFFLPCLWAWLIVSHWLKICDRFVTLSRINKKGVYP